MALMKKRASRLQTTVLYGLLAAVAITGAYFFFTSESDNGVQGSDPAIERLKNELTVVKDTDKRILTNLDLLLNDPRFDVLKQFGELPVEAGKQGRANPFLAL